PAGGESDPEVRSRSGVEAAFAEETPAGLGVGGQQLAAEELRRCGVRGVQPTAAAVLGRGSPVFVVQRVAEASREAFDGFGEADMVHRAQERVDVTGFAAAEAVVEADLRSDVEARALLIVKRTQPLERTDPGRLQRDALADDVGDVRARLDLV